MTTAQSLSNSFDNRTPFIKKISGANIILIYSLIFIALSSGETQAQIKSTPIHLDSEGISATFGWTSTALTFSEADGTEAIELGLPAPESCEVNIEVYGGNGKINSDFFIPSPATLNFNAGGAFLKNIPFDIIDNLHFEFAEEVILVLRNPTGVCSIGPDSLLTITLVDDDTAIAPFLQQVTEINKISATEGGFTGSVDPFDRFANRIAYWDDLDGDGNREWLAAAFSDDDGGSQTGAYWVLFPDANGQILSFTKISQISNWPGADLDPEDRFASEIAVLDDFDGDGIRELAIGSIFDDDGGIDRGAVYIMYANTDGSIRTSVKISQTSGGFGGTLGDGDRFGGGIAWMGDLDGDGNGTLAVGSYGDDFSGSGNSGAIWMLDLDSNAQVIDELRISQSSGGFTDTLKVQDSFGFSVTNAGDIDGDGTDDIATGIIGKNISASFQGGVYILFLNPDGSVKHQTLIADCTNFTGNLEEKDRMGTHVAGIPDLDHDGVPELAVGVQFEDAVHDNEGSVWIFYLSYSGTVKYYSKIAEGIGMVNGIFEIDDEFGSGIAVNPDPLPGGAIELLIGAQGDDDGGDGVGAMYRIRMDNKVCDTEIIPGGLTVEILGPGEVTMHWNDLAQVQSYEWRGRLAGMSGGKRKILSDNFFSASGLTPGQEYEWTVRASCTDSSLTPFSEIDSFILPLFLSEDLKMFSPGDEYPGRSSGLTPESLSQEINNKSNASQQFTLRPNPAQESVIVSTMGISSGTLSLFNLSGKVLKTIQLKGNSNTEIPLHNILPGIYFVQVVSGVSSLMQQLIVVE